MNKISESAIHKELDLIQGCISRMAHNSFIIKGWAILLISSVFVFWEKQNLSWSFCFIVCASLFVLWIMDSYFLCKEKEYRKLYSWVINIRKEGKEDFLYELDTSKFPNVKCSVIGSMFSTILPWFYILLILATITVVGSSKLLTENAKCINCNCKNT